MLTSAAGKRRSVAAGILLRSYAFDKYKTKKDNGDGQRDGNKAEPKKPAKVTIHSADPAAAKKAFADEVAVIDGVLLARDLVNEPANILGPVEFAARVNELEALGVTVEILVEKEMKKLGMGALLGVAQGSPRGARLAVMRWNGGKAKDTPVAFVGKGVTFDTGGNSIKPASGMEDMKGDMGGAAAVTGLMHALAARKAKANVVGVIGLVENAVDGHAQRPGDIVTSMSGQTIEVLNTDAEGRLVLADALWYCSDRFQPKFMVNLATLTGATMVALGQHYAGLFSNNDELANRLTSAGQATQERVWRMPLGTEYDKLIEFEKCRHEEHRRPLWRRHHRGAVPAALRQGYTLGASRHRRHRDGRAVQRDQPVMGLRLRRQAARPAGARQLRGVRPFKARSWPTSCSTT